MCLATEGLFSEGYICLTLSQTINLDASILKEFAEDNFKFDESDNSFPKGKDNTVRKGETASYKQFLLFPQCFQNTCTADKGLFGKGLKDISAIFTAFTISSCRSNNYKSEYI